MHSNNIVHSSVQFSSPCSSLVPIIDSLVIDPASVSAFATTADANFPFKTPVNIQALDASGNIITDGPNSALVRRLWDRLSQSGLAKQ